MARNSLNFKKNNAELVSADAAIAPILVSAKILTIPVEGKDVPASDAPLDARITAIGKLISTGDKTEDSAALISANGQLASQAEAAEAKLVAEKASVAAQASRIIELSGQLNIANDSVTTLTAKNLETSNLLRTTTDAGTRLTSEVASQKLAIARACLKCAAVVFNGTDGKALAADCSDADLAVSSKDMTFDSMVASYSGALHAAAGKLGITLASVPSTGTQTVNAPKKTATELCREDVIAQKKAGKWSGPE